MNKNVLFSVKSTVSAIALTFTAITVAAPAKAQLVHNYLLNGTLADSLGGPALTNNGGTVSASGLAFPANQGPSLTGGVNSNNYSIELNFQIDTINGYRKLIDFKNYTSDTGLYNLNGSLDYFNFVGSVTNTDIVANTPVQVILTRDNSTSLVVGYVNGVQKLSFTDSTNDAVFSTATANFLQDDNTTGGGESSAGTLTNLRIYDRALTAGEAAGRFNGTFTGGTSAAPEASSIALIALGLPFIGFVVRRRK